MLGLLGVCIQLGVAQAGSFQFSPVTIDLPSDQQAATVSLINSDNVPLSFQIRIFKWQQAGGKDSLEPADDLMIVSPPAVTVTEGKTFKVRVARRVGGAVGGEQAYRLMVDQLSPPQQDGAGNAMGVSILLRAALPVFVTDRNAEAKLSWRVRQDNAGIHIGVTNSGSRRAKITGLTLSQPNGSPSSSVTDEGLTGYVLAGSTMEFTLKSDKNRTVPKFAKGSQVVIVARDVGGASSGPNEIKETVGVE
jgi:fimbrial chaperone protein